MPCVCKQGTSMGWASGISRTARWGTRVVGYGHIAECDEDGCITVIDRGLAYICGGYDAVGSVDGGQYGCGGFFCGHHLYVTPRRPQRCRQCARISRRKAARIAAIQRSTIDYIRLYAEHGGGGRGGGNDGPVRGYGSLATIEAAVDRSIGLDS